MDAVRDEQLADPAPEIGGGTEFRLKSGLADSAHREIHSMYLQRQSRLERHMVWKEKGGSPLRDVRKTDKSERGRYPLPARRSG